MKRLFVFVLAVLMVFASCFSASAFTLDSVETSEELTAPSTADAQAALQETGLDIPLLDEKLGKLIYYQNFNGENYRDIDYLDAAVIPSASVTGSSTLLSLGASEEDPEDKYLVMTPINERIEWHELLVKFTDFTPLEGKYSAEYDYMSPNGDITGYMERWFVTPNPYKADGTSKDDLISRNKDSKNINDAKGTWLHSSVPGFCEIDADNITYFGFDSSSLFPQKGKAYQDNSINKIIEFRVIPNKGILYIDDLKIYYYPDHSFMYKYGTDISLETAGASDSITIKSPAEVNPEWAAENFTAWTDGDNIYYPGDVISGDQIPSYKTLYPMTIPTIDEKKGELVIFFDYEQGTDINQHFYKNSDYITVKTDRRADGTSSTTVDVDPTNSGNNVAKIYSENTGSQYRLFGPNFYSSPITYANAKYTVSYDLMLDDVSKYNDGFIRFTHKDGADSNHDARYSYSDIESMTWVHKEQSYTTDKGLKGFSTANNAKKNTETNTYYTSTWYVDNFALYCFPENAILFKESATSSNYKFIKDIEGDTYTFPSPEELGYDVPNSQKWMASDGTSYNVGEEIAVSELMYRSFYPFAQAADVPAMGYVFEGSEFDPENKNLYNYNHLTYVESIEDEGRTVLHARQYANWNTSYTNWANDGRILIRTATPFDPKEYSIVQYVYKITEAENVPDEYRNNQDYNESVAAPIKAETPDLKIWYYAPTGEDGQYNYFGTPSGENTIMGSPIRAIADGEYHVMEFDMRSTASNTNCPFIECETIGGLGFDPNTITWSGDSYIDSLRVYRAGITTVTYNTNAPDGAAVIKDTAPDKNRGLGTGYLLSNDYPEVEGYIFMGWATTPDATVSDVVSSITLTGDTEVYAVWQSADELSAPVIGKYASIRLGGADTTNNGIRFRATISAGQRVLGNLEEYGFIVAREDMLIQYGSELTHSFKKPDSNTPLYVEGKAGVYENGELKETIYSVDEITGDATFTGVCVGLDITNKFQITSNITARPYIKISNGLGNTVTIYGETHTSSLYNVAKAVKDLADAGDEQALADYNANREYIDQVIAVAEAE